MGVWPPFGHRCSSQARPREIGGHPTGCSPTGRPSPVTASAPLAISQTAFALEGRILGRGNAQPSPGARQVPHYAAQRDRKAFLDLLLVEHRGEGLLPADHSPRLFRPQIDGDLAENGRLVLAVAVEDFEGDGIKKVSGTVVRSTLRTVPAAVPDTFLNHAITRGLFPECLPRTAVPPILVERPGCSVMGLVDPPF